MKLENKKLEINIVRHGPSGYEQPIWRDVDTADDITTKRSDQSEGSKIEAEKGKLEAIEMVKRIVKAIAEKASADEEISIWASPTGRTLETAKVISQELSKYNLKVRGNDRNLGIKIFDQIGEVENFSWHLFQPIVKGGDVSFDGLTFFVDKKLSNPRNLDMQNYFKEDELHKIPTSVKDQWPVEFVKKIESFETFSSINKRIIRVLSRLMKINDKKYRVIIVTHDALISSMVSTFTSGQLHGINPAEFISLERRGDKLVVTQVGDIVSGNSEDSIIG